MALAFALTLFAGFVKGAVGFALPMIMISGLASVLPPEVALAGVIMPTVLSNVWQSLRGGLATAWASARKFRLYIGVVLVCIAFSAQLVRLLPQAWMFLLLGGPVLLFAVAQLVGWQLHIKPEHRTRAEVGIATFAGLVGGISGVWGPPTVTYLTAIRTPKREQIQIQGVVYGAGAVVLAAAHLRSGVLNAQTLPLSLALVVPAMLGMFAGLRWQDRLDQVRFRQATLVVLIVAGLNLLRRGVIGL